MLFLSGSLLFSVMMSFFDWLIRLAICCFAFAFHMARDFYGYRLNRREWPAPNFSAFTSIDKSSANNFAGMVFRQPIGASMAGINKYFPIPLADVFFCFGVIYSIVLYLPLCWLRQDQKG
jgi:hypothetical protein